MLNFYSYSSSNQLLHVPCCKRSVTKSSCTEHCKPTFICSLFISQFTCNKLVLQQLVFATDPLYMNFNKNQDWGWEIFAIRTLSRNNMKFFFSQILWNFLSTPIKVGLQYAVVTFRSMQWVKIVSYHTQGQVFESNYTEHKHYHVTLSIKPGSCTWKEIYSTTHRYMQNNDIQYMCTAKDITRQLSMLCT